MSGNLKTAAFTFVICSIFLILPLRSRSEIYRWVDERGVVHYTDNLMNVPENYRSKAEKPSLPEINTYEETSPVPETPPPSAESTKEPAKKLNLDEIKKQIEILRSQIEAKKELIRTIDSKRNLAINPYRNRIISKEDLELYEKYKKELPGDEKRLEELMKLISEGDSGKLTSSEEEQE